jgi:KDO2-lipid IV(A) lauroyltransferase
MKKLRYLFEALPVYLAFGIFRLLPLPVASRAGACLGGWLGSRLPVRRVALKNLAAALPELGEARRNEVALAMWRQLGRTVAEFPHLGTPAFNRRIRQVNSPALEALRTSGQPVIFIAGHLNNWEVAPLAAHLYGLPLTLIYRQTNNPFVNILVDRVRCRYAASTHRKGRGGMRHLVQAVRDGRSVGMLVDQKENGGIPVPFFHAPAMTTPLPVKLARKTGAHLVMGRTLRNANGEYHMDILPLALPSGMTEENDAAQMAAINRQFETWIRETPEDWFWLHRRWPKEG